MLPTHQMAEIFSLDPSLIVPIPDMPMGVMGVCNWRGQVLWLVDLAYLLGIGMLSDGNFDRSKYSILVIRSEHKFLGLAVNQVGGLLTCDRSQVQPTSLISQMQVLNSCIKGQIVNSDGKILLVLNGGIIIDFFGKLSQSKEENLSIFF